LEGKPVPSIHRARSVLAVQDLAVSSRYYMDVLGFTEDDIASPGWRFLSLDQFHLMLGECRDEVSAGATGNHSWFIHLLVDDVDTYHAEVKSRGAAVVSPPADRSYGLREFVLTTPDGHRLVVGQAIQGA
jgi:predicted enzyme related to lactoylglutathione lyase